MFARWVLAARSLYVALALVAVSCGGDVDEADEPPPEGTYRVTVWLPDPATLKSRGGALFSIVDAEGREIAVAGLSSTWNTYCANDPLEMHVYVNPATRPVPTLERLPKADPALYTAYAFATKGGLYVDDLGNWRRFKVADRGHPPVGGEAAEVARDEETWCGKFVVGGVRYRSSPGRIEACTGSGEDEICDGVDIRAATFPYVYAEAFGHVVTVTNWGDVLMHGADGWCRAVAQGDSFACEPGADRAGPGPEAPREFQFYSSVKYADKTLLGRWPGGGLYEFDGHRLTPFAGAPPLPAGEIRDASEAQSMAVYCGDLYVGYWPRGDLWVKHQGEPGWTHMGRAFTHPEYASPAIPYLGQEPEGADWAFLGQRITAIALYGDSAYLSTSNLRAWEVAVPTPALLSGEQLDQYGALIKMRRAGCATAQPAEGLSPVHVDFSATHIRILQRGNVLAEAVNPGVMPGPGHAVVRKASVFGRPLQLEGLAVVH